MMNKLLFLGFIFVTFIHCEIMQKLDDNNAELTSQDQNTEEVDGEYSIVAENGQAVNPAGKVKGWMKNLSNLKKQIKRGVNRGENFRGWMKKYRRNYRAEIQNMRYQIFNRNQMLIGKHNKAGDSKYLMGLNKFADLTDQQFQQTYLSKIVPQIEFASVAPPPLSQSNDSSSRLLQSFVIDWRNRIKFAPIKDQGSCAACYAFANLGALELNWALRNGGVQPSLSEQQIIDCCGTAGYKCNGCVSGGLGMAYQFLAKYGVQTTSSYPYAGFAQKCNLGILKGKKYLRTDRSYYQFSGIRNTINYLSRGPLAVAADATTWKFYTSGTFDGCPKSNFNYTHACVIIGINQDGSWIIRNSWGTDWGMGGYITLQSGNSCGITNYVYIPLAS